MWSPDQLLAALDQCAENFTFPMLDNGYVYLAATRLSLHRSTSDWAIVIEVFGYSPRAGLPDISVYTFGSRLRDRDEPGKYATPEAYQSYLNLNPYNESRFFNPIPPGPWLSDDDCDSITEDVRTVVVRDQPLHIPGRDTFESHGIVLEDPGRIRVWELCRYLAESHRDLILATTTERRVSVPQELEEFLVLDSWRHPDLLNEEKPGSSAAFVGLAEALAQGDARLYTPKAAPNTHWSNWPEGGTL